MTVRIGDDVEDYDAIVLACGMQPNVESNPLCRKILKQWPVPIVGGFPCVSEDAEWSVDKLFCVGSLSSLSIGPDAANLMGMRRSAQIVANALHCRCWLRQENVLKNAYAVFMEDDSDDSDTEPETELSSSDDSHDEEGGW